MKLHKAGGSTEHGVVLFNDMLIYGGEAKVSSGTAAFFCLATRAALRIHSRKRLHQPQYHVPPYTRRTHAPTRTHFSRGRL